MKFRILKPAIAAAALLAAAPLVAMWLTRQGATVASLATLGFWKSQWVLAGRFLQAGLLPLIHGVGTAEWLIFGAAASVLTWLLVRLGRLHRLKGRGTSKRTSPRRELVLRLATRGQSAETIARHTGLSRDAVRSIRYSRAAA